MSKLYTHTFKAHDNGVPYWLIVNDKLSLNVLYRIEALFYFRSFEINAISTPL